MAALVSNATFALLLVLNGGPAGQLQLDPPYHSLKACYAAGAALTRFVPSGKPKYRCRQNSEIRVTYVSAELLHP